MQLEIERGNVKDLYRLCDEIKPKSAGKLLKQYANFVETLSNRNETLILVDNPNKNTCFIFIQDHKATSGYIASIEICQMGLLKQILTYWNSNSFNKLDSYSKAETELKEKAFKYRRFVPDVAFRHWKSLVAAAYTSIAGPNGHYRIEDCKDESLLVEVLNENINLKVTAMLIKR